MGRVRTLSAPARRQGALTEEPPLTFEKVPFRRPFRDKELMSRAVVRQLSPV